MGAYDNLYPAFFADNGFLAVNSMAKNERGKPGRSPSSQGAPPAPLPPHERLLPFVAEDRIADNVKPSFDGDKQKTKSFPKRKPRFGNDHVSGSSKYQNSITSVPAVTSSRPTAARRVSFSRNTRPEKATVTRMLSLSMGTTTLAGPSCRAR